MSNYSSINYKLLLHFTLWCFLSEQHIGMPLITATGDTNITVTLSGAEELPTNVSGWVTWGDGHQAEEVGFLDITRPGAHGSVSHVLEHVYEEPGDYFVTWYIENKVSNLNLTKLVRTKPIY